MEGNRRHQSLGVAWQRSQFLNHTKTFEDVTVQAFIIAVNPLARTPVSHIGVPVPGSGS